MTIARKSALLLVQALLTWPALAATDAKVERSASGALTVTWAGTAPVDVFVADRPDAVIKDATLISANDADGRHAFADAGNQRRYILLRDFGTARIVRAAERSVPLEHGSNFRDIGGYAGAGGRTVRWGLIYRSGATPLLTDADVARIKALGIRNMIDLRSSEERVLAPTRLDGIPYAAVGYSLTPLLSSMKRPGANPVAVVYGGFPDMLAPQVRILFDTLLRREGPVAYNCSAGQDRTGFATAMLLSALGVPRETIYRDYLMSTALRHPEYEMAKIDTVAQANNPIALFFAKYQQDPEAAKAAPLHEPDGTPYLAYAFTAIERRWGSVDRYLEKEAGVGPVEIAALRAAYLE